LVLCSSKIQLTHHFYNKEANVASDILCWTLVAIRSNGCPNELSKGFKSTVCFDNLIRVPCLRNGQPLRSSLSSDFCLNRSRWMKVPLPFKSCFHFALTSHIDDRNHLNEPWIPQRSRPRRNRKSPWVRAMVRETSLTARYFLDFLLELTPLAISSTLSSSWKTPATQTKEGVLKLPQCQIAFVTLSRQ
jgi:hypothetical protein